jgi:hypothetical protein
LTSHCSTAEMEHSRRSSLASIASVVPPPYSPTCSSRISQLFAPLRASTHPPAYEPSEPDPRYGECQTPTNSFLEKFGISSNVPCHTTRYEERLLAVNNVMLAEEHPRTPGVEALFPSQSEKRRPQQQDCEWVPLLIAPPPRSTSPNHLSFSKSLHSSTGHAWATLRLHNQPALEFGDPTYQAGSRIHGALELDLPKRKAIQSIELVVIRCSC